MNNFSMDELLLLVLQCFSFVIIIASTANFLYQIATGIALLSSSKINELKVSKWDFLMLGAMWALFMFICLLREMALVQ